MIDYGLVWKMDVCYGSVVRLHVAIALTRLIVYYGSVVRLWVVVIFTRMGKTSGRGLFGCDILSERYGKDPIR